MRLGLYFTPAGSFSVLVYFQNFVSPCFETIYSIGPSPCSGVHKCQVLVSSPFFISPPSPVPKLWPLFCLFFFSSQQGYFSANLPHNSNVICPFADLNFFQFPFHGLKWESGGLQSRGPQTVRHDLATK